MIMICTAKKAQEEELESRKKDVNKNMNFVIIIPPVRCMNIGRYGGNGLHNHEPQRTKRHQSYYKLSDSFDTIGTVRNGSSTSSM